MTRLETLIKLFWSLVFAKTTRVAFDVLHLYYFAIKFLRCIFHFGFYSYIFSKCDHVYFNVKRFFSPFFYLLTLICLSDFRVQLMVVQCPVLYLVLVLSKNHHFQHIVEQNSFCLFLRDFCLAVENGYLHTGLIQRVYFLFNTGILSKQVSMTYSGD